MKNILDFFKAFTKGYVIYPIMIFIIFMFLCYFKKEMVPVVFVAYLVETIIRFFNLGMYSGKTPKTIKTKYFPFGDFIAITLFGVIFVKKEYADNKTVLNHEKIHVYQIMDIGILFFYSLYILEFLVKLAYYRNYLVAYKNISFEREAYKYEDDLSYCENRKMFNWIDLIYVK